jgi:hypothetical protein
LSFSLFFRFRFISFDWGSFIKLGKLQVMFKYDDISIHQNNTSSSPPYYQGCLTEWLRWKTRNLLGNSRIGSNPIAVETQHTFQRSWFSGRMTACQAVDLGSIPGDRISNF